jgi:ATPase subunit of ABC transporter with duplicated ATPase domains
VRGNVQEGFGEIQKILDRYNAINDAFANPDADFDKLLAEQAELQEKIEAANAWELERELEIAADALRLPPWDADVSGFLAGCFLLVFLG